MKAWTVLYVYCISTYFSPVYGDVRRQIESFISQCLRGHTIQSNSGLNIEKRIPCLLSNWDLFARLITVGMIVTKGGVEECLPIR